MNTVYNLKQFIIDPKNKVLVADLSDISPPSGFLFDLFRSAPGEAAVACLYVKSHKTDRIVCFLVMDYVRDNEDEITGEITHWVLKPNVGELGLDGWSMTIFND